MPSFYGRMKTALGCNSFKCQKVNFCSFPSCRKILPTFLYFGPKILLQLEVLNLSLNENMLRLNHEDNTIRHEGLDSPQLKFNVCMHLIGLQLAKEDCTDRTK